MATAKTRPISINDQLVSVTQRAAKLRASLDARQAATVVEGIKELENSLSRISEVLVPFEQRFSHLQALAGIGQVVNSTLELDEVLQIVMDTEAFASPLADGETFVVREANANGQAQLAGLISVDP